MLIDKAAMVGETASVPDNQRFSQLRFGRMRRSFLRSLDDNMIAATTALRKTFGRRRDHENIFAECTTDPSH